jgi:hypothetical protein
VFAWHWPVPEIAPVPEQIRLWRFSWQARGWRPSVFSDGAEALTRRCPKAAQVAKVFESGAWPTPNPALYELGCWLRWFSLADVIERRKLPGALLVDTDVINYGFRVGDLAQLTTNFSRPVLFLDPCASPAAWVTLAGLYELQDWMLNWRPAAGAIASDMYALDDWARANPSRAYPPGVDLQTGAGFPCLQPAERFAGWNRAKLVHFAAGSCSRYAPGQPKHLAINRLRPVK